MQHGDLGAGSRGRALGYHLPCGVYFAPEPQVWGRSARLYDPALPGTAPARGYLVTAEQFCDIGAQEMSRDEPGELLDLAAVIADSRVQVGRPRQGAPRDARTRPGAGRWIVWRTTNAQRTTSRRCVTG